MEPYEVLRGQWLLAALGGGIVLVLTAVAAYLALWLPRPGPASDRAEGHAPPGRGSPAGTVFLALPVVLVLTYAGIAVFMVVAFAQKIVSPPNW